jgi:hypothetical protein
MQFCDVYGKTWQACPDKGAITVEFDIALGIDCVLPFT